MTWQIIFQAVLSIPIAFAVGVPATLIAMEGVDGVRNWLS